MDNGDKSYYGKFPPHYENWTFVFSHITTSANGCRSIKENGILDLVETYKNTESELRTFLDSHGVYIDLTAKTLEYDRNRYDISYRTPTYEEEIVKSILGLKLWKKYVINVFLVNNDPDIVYRGDVHERPEILRDIDNILGTTFVKEWTSTHTPYEIIAITSGENIVYDNCPEDEEDLRDMIYLQEAYDIACGNKSQHAVELKEHIQIPPSQIRDIHSL